MQEGNAEVGQIEAAKSAVTAMSRLFDRPAQASLIVVHIAKHKMGRPIGEESDNLVRSDIAAVQHLMDFEAFQHPHGV
jgi:hypothetical protein